MAVIGSCDLILYRGMLFEPVDLSQIVLVVYCLLSVASSGSGEFVEVKTGSFWTGLAIYSPHRVYV